MTGLIALGDSFTCGEGVGVRVPAEQTWTGLLAAVLPDSSRVQLAQPGAKVRDVVDRQLPHLQEATVATLLIGLNDIARPGFVAGRVHRDVIDVVVRLCAVADLVLLGRLHDPVRLLWVPAQLRRLVRQRRDVVNAAVDEAATLPRVHVVDLDSVPELREREGWAVDRVHPSPAGHAGLAAAAAHVLREAGRAVPDLPPPPRAVRPTSVQRAWWLSRHGIPYAATSLTRVAGPQTW